MFWAKWKDRFVRGYRPDCFGGGDEFVSLPSPPQEAIKRRSGCVNGHGKFVLEERADGLANVTVPHKMLPFAVKMAPHE